MKTVIGLVTIGAFAAAANAQSANAQGTCQVSQMALGWDQTCAMTSETTVKCWGSNGDGQLGYGTGIPSAFVPGEELVFDRPIKKLSAGPRVTCAIFQDGKASCWGSNTMLQLGTTDNTDRYMPGSFVNIAESIDDIVIGRTHSCALLTSGSVRCWGDNDQGQLGIGSWLPDREFFVHETINVNFGTTEKVNKLSTRGYQTCALFESSKVSCWGPYDQFDHSKIHYTPVNFESGSEKPIVDVSAGEDFICVLFADGVVRCSGETNYNGYLGQIGKDLETIKFVRFQSGSAHTCGVADDSNVYCWGSNVWGQLGFTQDLTFEHTEQPLMVQNVANAENVFVGFFHTCAVNKDGLVKCWGNNWYGGLGYGDSEYLRVPRNAFVPVCTSSNANTVVCREMDRKTCDRDADCTFDRDLNECRTWKYGDQCIMNKKRCKKSSQCHFDRNLNKCLAN